jgi:hypothetical protein
MTSAMASKTLWVMNTGQADVSVAAALDSPSSRQLGDVLLRAIDNNNYLMVTVDGSQVVIGRRTGGAFEPLGRHRPGRASPCASKPA